MAIRLVDEYSNRTGGATTSYPHGSAINRSAPGADDGTPLEQKWVNDLLGFLQGLVDTAGITPDGNPDTAIDSQYFDGLLHAARGMTEVDVGGSSNVTLQTYDSRAAVVRLFGTLTADIDIIVPDAARFYLFINETDGDFTVTVKTSGGTGIAVRKGNSQWLYSDGTDVKRIQAVADQEYAGDPNGNLSADTLYQRAWDTSVSPTVLYIATVADGTIAGTTWTPLHRLIGAISNSGSTDGDDVPELAAFGVDTAALAGTGIPGAIGRAAIVEAGTNYIRYSNGKQVCWGTDQRSYDGTVDYIDKETTYPAAFASAPDVSIAPRVSSGAGGTARASRCDIVVVTTTYVRWDVVLGGTDTNHSKVGISYIAWGPWK